MYGVPDYGLVSITELIELTARIAGAVDIPVLADADDGGGSPLNVYRAMQGFERAGIAAVMIEDHVQVKHVGGEGELVPTSAMADKVKAAVDARRGDTIVLARGDSVSVGESAEAAIERGVAYAEAGADMLFFAGMSLEDCPRAGEAVQKPLMTTVRDTPLDVLKHQKIALAVYAAHALQLALGAADRGLAELKRSARIEGFRENAIDGETYSKLLRSDEERTRARNLSLDVAREAAHAFFDLSDVQAAIAEQKCRACFLGRRIVGRGRVEAHPVLCRPLSKLRERALVETGKPHEDMDARVRARNLEAIAEVALECFEECGSAPRVSRSGAAQVLFELSRFEKLGESGLLERGRVPVREPLRSREGRDERPRQHEKS